MKIDVEDELSRLRGFQRDTADYAFARLFGDGDRATSRFLVADEVGLGKTMVARGVIARTIDHLQATGDERVDVVYICSNAAIAAQNLRKLAPAGVPVEHRTERLTLLAFRLSERDHQPINLIALTPGTALAEGTSAGRFEERLAILQALRQLWGGHRLRGDGMMRVFAGAASSPRGHASLVQRVREERKQFGRLSPEALEHFGEQIRLADLAREEHGLPDLDTALHTVARRYGPRGEPSRAVRQEANQIIGELREALAMTGARLLQPDLLVLDEFQRFREVLHADSGYTSEIAQHLFSYYHAEHARHTRVLMLSATPYVMHTTRAEAAAEGENHYEDFIATYRFLAEGLANTTPEEQTEALRSELAAMRRGIADLVSEGRSDVHAAADAVSNRLRQVMVRTERLAATPDRNGMLITVRADLPVPSAGALRQYAATARVAEYLRTSPAGLASSDVVEYWKAAPYTLSYLGAHDYQVAQRLRELAGERAEHVDAALVELLRDSPAALPWERIRTYEPLPPEHAGLAELWRYFFDETGAHRLLWLPASMPYYRAGGAFETPAARRLTKRLIFSAWTLVPTAIATLTTYEAERRLRVDAQAAGAQVYEYDDDRRFLQRIRFGTGTESMTNLQFLLPFPVLADLGDPLVEAAALRTEGIEPTFEALYARMAAKIAGLLEPVTGGRSTERGAGSTSWYTLAPLLLSADRVQTPELILHEDDGESVAFLRHVNELERLRQVALGELPGELPPVPEDLVDVLTMNALTGPATVLYRALRRVRPGADVSALVRGAAIAAEGFRRLVNSPEAYRIIDSEPGDGEFWRKLLTYCAQGNLQAVLDEYVALLVENRGYDRSPDPDDAVLQAAEDLRSVLGRHAVTYRPAVVVEGQDGKPAHWGHESMRGRFALRYGSKSADDVDGTGDVGLAFNSPFWPFILATTSVGQEGLDFHQYCHAVTHWNLPGNPVDLEQREGRVHRYKGHAVRKNVGRVVPPPDGTAPPWRQAFAAARDQEGDSDMSPLWVFAPDSLAGEKALIERHLPLVPYTRERSVIEPLLGSVALYRMAFGQPRQDELLGLVEGLGDEQRRELARVRIDLTPPMSSPRTPPRGARGE